MPETPKNREPRWHAMVALVAVGGLRLALPHQLSVGPDWLLLAVIGVLVVLATSEPAPSRATPCVSSSATCSSLSSPPTWPGRSTCCWPRSRRTGSYHIDLLRSAAALWITNVIVFASWYWRLELLGGPPFPANSAAATPTAPSSSPR